MSSLPNYLHLRAEPQRITAARIKHLAVKGVQRPATCSLDEIKELCTTVMAHIAEMERRAGGGGDQQTAEPSMSRESVEPQPLALVGEAARG